MKSLLKRNIEKFVEIGPKKTLLNFITKDFEGEKISINTLEDLKQYV